MTTDVPKKQSRWRTVIRAVFSLLLLVAVCLAYQQVNGQWASVRLDFEKLGVGRLFVTFILSTVGFGLFPIALHLLYRDLVTDERSGLVELAAAYYVANFFRYLPGKLIAPAFLIQKAGLRKAPLLQALMTTVLQSILIGGMAFLTIVLATTTSAMLDPLLFLFLIPLLVLIHPAVLSRLLTIALGLLGRRDEPLKMLSTKAWFTGFSVMLTGWAMIGCGFALLIVSFRSLSPIETTMCTLVYSASFGAGFAAVFAPAGVGVREGLLVWFLTVPVPVSDGPEKLAIAMSIAVVHRFVVTASDVALLILGGVLLRAQKTTVQSSRCDGPDTRTENR